MSVPYPFNALQGRAAGLRRVLDPAAAPNELRSENSQGEMEPGCFPVALPHYKVRTGELFFGDLPISYVSPIEAHVLLSASGQVSMSEIVERAVATTLPSFVRDALLTSATPIPGIAELRADGVGKERVVVMSGESSVAEQKMGAWIVENRNRYAIEIVTAFSACENSTNPAFGTASELGKLRNQENALSARILGASPLFLEFALTDVPLDPMCLKRLAANLMQFLGSRRPRRLFVPIGTSAASRIVLDVVVGLYTADAIPVGQLVVYDDTGCLHSVDSTSSCLTRLSHAAFRLDPFEFTVQQQEATALRTSLSVYRTHRESPVAPAVCRFWNVADLAS